MFEVLERVGRYSISRITDPEEAGDRPYLVHTFNRSPWPCASIEEAEARILAMAEEDGEDPAAYRRKMESYRRDRALAVLAMEYLVRQVNDEDVLEPWLMVGVADGDIPDGCTDPTQVDDYYTDPENFADLVACFLRRMVRARASGGLYCGGVCAGERTEEEAQEAGTAKAYRVLNVMHTYLDDLETGVEWRRAEGKARSLEYIKTRETWPQDLKDYTAEALDKIEKLTERKEG